MTIPDEAASGGVSTPFEPSDSVRIQVSGGTVPDEAVGAAAEAMYHKFNGLIRPALVKVILEAAAPFIAAQAWDEGEHAGYMNRSAEERHGIEPHTNPYRSEQ